MSAVKDQVLHGAALLMVSLLEADESGVEWTFQVSQVGGRVVLDMLGHEAVADMIIGEKRIEAQSSVTISSNPGMPLVAEIRRAMSSVRGQIANLQEARS